MNNTLWKCTFFSPDAKLIPTKLFVLVCGCSWEFSVCLYFSFSILGLPTLFISLLFNKLYEFNLNFNAGMLVKVLSFIIYKQTN